MDLGSTALDRGRVTAEQAGHGAIARQVLHAHQRLGPRYRW
jgi:hypothetical protein